jgi:hypothetical protein
LKRASNDSFLVKLLIRLRPALASISAIYGAYSRVSLRIVL